MNEAAPQSSATQPFRVAIIGGGITGLATAQRLKKLSPKIDVTIFEASRRLGGIIRTEEADGLLMELGPDSFITNKPGGIQLCEEIGYSDKLIPTDARFRRSLVLSNGRPQPVPDGFMLMAPAKPWAILSTPVLSFTGKLRLLWEYFKGRPASSAADESLASFVRRRFGTETLDRLVQPLVGGIYTSDPEKLSLRATMPRFLDMEAKYGSVIRGTLAEAKSSARSPGGGSSGDASSGSGARYGLFAAPEKGLGDLIHALEAWLRQHSGIHFAMGSGIQSVERCHEHGKWVVKTAEGQKAFDAAVITLGTHTAASLLPASDAASLRKLLTSIEYASSAIVVSGHRLSDFQHPMDAFGLVVPAIERRRILAVSFSSRKFLHRAPDGQIVLRTFIGGAMQPELMAMDDDAMVAAVNEELTSIFGMKSEPMFAEVVRYNHSMPQYHVGHLDRVAAIEQTLRNFPGLYLAGSAYHGVGIPDSIASGWTAAEQIAKQAAA
ncbi:MAG: protoporphyrinogen oxidase [Planctomycetaceae bacterium]|nr:protoporphyrinogen oxidase [Planctomycetaceae bacterium]